MFSVPAALARQLFKALTHQRWRLRECWAGQHTAAGLSGGPSTWPRRQWNAGMGALCRGGIIKKVLIWFVLLVVLIVVACMIGWALSLTGLAGKYVAIIVVAVIAIARCLPLYIHMFYLRMARGADDLHMQSAWTTR
ncbi:hypothetical protein OEZ86_011750 [Tetradesmus obliquus]|nr:hypothetical protein OEZ86_011750 [Tetradesmus obliquus]